MYISRLLKVIYDNTSTIIKNNKSIYISNYVICGMTDILNLYTTSYVLLLFLMTVGSVRIHPTLWGMNWMIPCVPKANSLLFISLSSSYVPFLWIRINILSIHHLFIGFLIESYTTFSTKEFREKSWWSSFRTLLESCYSLLSYN